MIKYSETTEKRIANTMYVIEQELRRAMFHFPEPFSSSHEGFAVLKEEVDELWDEIRDNKRKGTLERQYSEAVQVGAMAAKYIVHLTPSCIGK